jgi:hypothetical protein
MENEKFNDLAKIESSADEKKKRKGFLPWLFRSGKTKLARVARTGARVTRGSGPGGAALRGIKGVGAAGGRAVPFAARGSGIFGRGFASLFGSKAGLMGLLLGCATIAAGAGVIYNLVSNPNAQKPFMQGLFQGSFYKDMTDTAAKDLREENTQGALDNYWKLGSDVAGGGEVVENQEFSEPANFEQGEIDAGSIAEAVAKPEITKSELSPTAGVNLGSGSSGTASGAMGNADFGSGQSETMRQGAKATIERTAPWREGITASNPFAQGKSVFARLNEAKGRDMAGMKQGKIDAWVKKFRPSDKEVAVDFGAQGVTPDGGIGIGEGAAGKPGVPKKFSGIGLPEDYGGVNTNVGPENNINEDPKPAEVKKWETTAAILAGAAVVCILAAGVMAKFPTTNLAARILAGLAVGSIAAACVYVLKIKSKYPDWYQRDNIWQWLYFSMAVAIPVMAAKIIFGKAPTASPVTPQSNAAGNLIAKTTLKGVIKAALKKTALKLVLWTGGVSVLRAIFGDVPVEPPEVPEGDVSGDDTGTDDTGDDDTQ